MEQRPSPCGPPLPPDTSVVSDREDMKLFALQGFPSCTHARPSPFPEPAETRLRPRFEGEAEAGSTIPFVDRGTWEPRGSPVPKPTVIAVRHEVSPTHPSPTR